MPDARVGVLLTNLGTPDAPTPRALRRYLAEFLWDPRVVDLPRLLWWVLLHGVILRVRPRRSARLYQQIWTKDGSPLLLISQRQAEAVQRVLADLTGRKLPVALGMRYGTPSIASALQDLHDVGTARIVVLPLYPQYSSSTTASTFDAISDAFRNSRWMPEIRFISRYHEEPEYVQALAASIQEAWQEFGPTDRLLFSFHGMPKRYATEGDPYGEECHRTAQLVAEKLGLSAPHWQLAFQSRFGREEWLQPYTDQVLESWARAGIKRVHVVCPGFSADCLETLEEIAEENREVFLHAGGQDYCYIPALNDRSEHIQMMASLITQNLQGWI